MQAVFGFFESEQCPICSDGMQRCPHATSKHSRGNAGNTNANNWYALMQLQSIHTAMLGMGRWHQRQQLVVVLAVLIGREW
jgi:hypothetical protein